jgi:hypothetical protein
MILLVRCVTNPTRRRQSSNVGGGGAAGLGVDDVTGEDVLRLGVQQLRLALKVAVEQLRGTGVEPVRHRHLAIFCAAGVHLCPHARGQHLAQLHSPLVEGVDTPDEALGTIDAYQTLHRLMPTREQGQHGCKGSEALKMWVKGSIYLTLSAKTKGFPRNTDETSSMTTPP